MDNDRVTIVAITVCILCLTVLFMLSMRSEPKPDYIASPQVKRLMNKSHGTPVMVCRGTVCSFKRGGKVIKVRI
jgi:hypothetical protein